MTTTPFHFLYCLTGATLLFGAILCAADDDAGRHAYVMISGWGLYPELDGSGNSAASALGTALSAISKSRVSGIVYGTLGMTPQIREEAELREDFDPEVCRESLPSCATTMIGLLSATQRLPI